MIQGIDSISDDSKRAILRVDFNVPLDSEGQITDDTRIQKSLPTIEYLLGKKDLGIVLLAHLGRPKGSRVAKYSLKPVLEKLKQVLPKVNILFCDDVTSVQAKKQAKNLQPGEILFCENIRYYEEETSKDDNEREAFAKTISELGDVYVDDAFGACHRKHASIFDIAKFLPGYAGMLLKKEIEILESILKKPERPFVAIIGGSKVSSKIAVLKNLLNKVDTILIGGAMAYTFQKARALEVGTSMVENDFLSEAFQIVDKADYNQVEFKLPEDHIVASEFSEKGKIKTSPKLISVGFMGMDIGPKTRDTYSKVIKNAKTVLWNGPMGVFEMDKFAKGTMAVAKALTKVKGTTVVGGGDSVYAIKKAGLEDKVTHISTGGGATLEFIEGKTLPGIAALEKE